MRRKLSLLVATALAGTVIGVGGAAPAHACHDATTEPVTGWACYQMHQTPPVGQWVQHYYDEVGEAWYRIYCLLWDPTC